MKDMNFIPPNRCRQMRAARHLLVAGGLCAAWLLLLAVTSAAAYAMYAVDASAVTGKLDTLEHRVAEDQAATEAMTAQVAATRRALEASKDTGNQPDWSVLMALLAIHLGDDVVLAACDLSPQGATGAHKPTDGPHTPLDQRRFLLTVTGFGRSQASVSRYVLELEKIQLFRQVKLLTSSRRRFYDTEAVAFKLECAL